MTLALAVSHSRAPLPAFVVVGIYWGSFAAQVPDIKAGIGAGDGAFGLALLCSGVGAVLSMWVAPLFDRLFGAMSMRFAALATACAFIALGFVTSVPAFALAMFLCGATSGALDVVMNARVSELEARHERALMNLNHAGFSFAYAASALCAGVLREAGVEPLQVFSGLALGTLAMMVPMHQAPHVETADVHSDPRPAGIGRAVLCAGLITLVAFMAENATEVWSALHIERTLGGSAAQGALGPTLLGLTMGIGRLMGQLVTPRGAEAPMIVGAALLTAMGTSLAATADTRLLAYIGFAVMGLGVSVIAPLALALVGRLVSARNRTRAIARTAAMGYVGFLVGPALLGFVAELFGLRAAFATVAVSLLALPLLLRPLWTLARSPSSVR